MLRAGSKEETQLRLPATTEFARSLIKSLNAQQKASKRARNQEKVLKHLKKWTSTVKMLEHRRWDSRVDAIRESETATLAGNLACTDTMSVKIVKDTR
eukprot:2294462-Pleurochrysis_carterae.AAC.2